MTPATPTDRTQPVLKDLSPHAWPQRGLGSDLWLVFVAYALLAFAAIVVARQPGTIAVIWLANGVAIALIASAPPSRTVAMLAMAALGNLVANLLYGDPLGLSLAFLPPNTLDVALGVYLVRRSGRAERFASDHGSFLRVLVAGSLLPPLLGATTGAATLQALGFATFERVWADWYIGAALGGVAMLPLTLALRSGPAGVALGRLSDPGKLVSLALVAATSLTALRFSPYPFIAISVVLITIAFVRPRLTTFVSVPTVVAVLAVALALGWFKPVGSGSGFGHVVMFLSVMLVVIPAQVVSVVVARQRTLSEMLSAVGSRIDDIIIFVDMNGVYRWMNQARAQFWGVPNEQALGRKWEENMSASAYEGIVRPLFESARGGAVARRLVDFDYPTKGRRTIDMLFQPARDEDGHQIGVLYCGTDVTELEASRRHLQQLADKLATSNQSLEQFVRISSHDLREPLNTIVQFCDLIARGPGQELDASGQLYFSHVRDGAARMKRMLDEVQAFVRLDEAETLPTEAIDLDQLVGEVKAALRASIEATGASIRGPALGSATGHRELLFLVIQNLLSNALKFVAAGRKPEVEISVTRGGGECRIHVRDNGIGIAAAHIGELGTPFRRLHARRKFEGTGLGLSICQRIAKRHGGRLDVESEPGVGSCFTVVIADASVAVMAPEASLLTQAPVTAAAAS